MKALFFLLAVSGALLTACGKPSTEQPATPADVAVSQPAAPSKTQALPTHPDPSPPPDAAVRRPPAAQEPPAEPAPETPPDEHSGHVMPTP